jgi:NAD+ synthase (glutamine-hydrolysing)
VPIDEATDREIAVVTDMLGGRPPTELTRQNVQARLRGQRMWNWANTSGALFLQTGDMSEKAVGYTTMGGDLEGALSVIANVPKTVVVALLDRLHARFGFTGIAATLATEPGPELADAQQAEQELMPFPVLDACLQLYAGEKMSPDEMTAALGSLFPSEDGAPEGLTAPLHAPVLAVDLQVGAVAALAARRLARPRPRARAADAGRPEERVAVSH